jgi:hypothetical protein
MTSSISIVLTSSIFLVGFLLGFFFIFSFRLLKFQPIISQVLINVSHASFN